MNALPQVVVDLLAAREVLAVRGLAKGALCDDDGTVCARGALLLATGHAERDVMSMWWSRARLDSRVVTADLLISATVTADDTAYWNNAPERTQAEVEAAFLEAASLALSEAAARGDYR